VTGTAEPLARRIGIIRVVIARLQLGTALPATGVIWILLVIGLQVSITVPAITAAIHHRHLENIIVKNKISIPGKIELKRKSILKWVIGR